jgi:putative transcriptional regulator
VKWNLRLVAAQRDAWKSSQLHRMLTDAGLVISAGKMSGLWAGQPVTIRLDDLDVICEVLNCTPSDLLVREPGKARATPDRPAELEARAAGESPRLTRRHSGRSRPPL